MWHEVRRHGSGYGVRAGLRETGVSREMLIETPRTVAAVQSATYEQAWRVPNGWAVVHRFALPPAATTAMVLRDDSEPRLPLRIQLFSREAGTHGVRSVRLLWQGPHDNARLLDIALRGDRCDEALG